MLGRSCAAPSGSRWVFAVHLGNDQEAVASPWEERVDLSCSSGVSPCEIFYNAPAPILAGLWIC